MGRKTMWGVSVGVIALGLSAAVPGAAPRAADLPKSSLEILEKADLPASVLDGIDDELKVPADWLAKARAQGKVVILSTWDDKQFRYLVRPFNERYPFVALSYTRASYNARVLKPLIAYKEGRYVTDILTGFDNSYPQFVEAGALEDLSDIPNYKLLGEGMRDPNHLWLGQRLRYWCLAYNTNRVKKEDLPRIWDDILTDKRLANRRLAVANRTELWLQMLWETKGEAWATDFTRKLINEVRPQLRKEGTNAMVSLVVAGEFDVALPSAAYRVKQYAAKGAPVGWHCPEPVPMAVSGLGMLKGAPNIHAAKLFTNWFLSKEGQVAQFAADGAPPIHPALQDERFLAYPREIVGRKIAFRKSDQHDSTVALAKVWDPIWGKGEAAEKAVIHTFEARLDAVKNRGALVGVTRAGAPVEFGVSGARTALTIAGKKDSRDHLKPGMTCRIVLADGAKEARELSCR